MLAANKKSFFFSMGTYQLAPVVRITEGKNVKSSFVI